MSNRWEQLAAGSGGVLSVLPLLNASRIVKDVEAGGTAIRSENGSLKLSGSPLADNLRTLVKEHKDAILQYLAPKERYPEIEHELASESVLELMADDAFWKLFDRASIALTRIWRQGNRDGMRQALKTMLAISPEDTEDRQPELAIVNEARAEEVGDKVPF